MASSYVRCLKYCLVVWRRRLDAIDNLLEETSTMANHSHSEAARTYQESLRTLTAVESIRQSTTNVTQFEQQANQVKEQVKLLTEGIMVNFRLVMPMDIVKVHSQGAAAVESRVSFSQIRYRLNNLN